MLERLARPFGFCAFRSELNAGPQSSLGPGHIALGMRVHLVIPQCLFDGFPRVDKLGVLCA
jgi:hypothetical protein